MTSQEDYSKNGMLVKAWGPPSWIMLHTIAQNYPQEPTQQQKDEYLIFFKSVGNVLPCRYCRESYQLYIKQKSTLLCYPVMRNRKTLSKWLYLVHNKVNKKLGVKKEIPTFEEVTEKYESFRSKCGNKSPEVIEKVVKKGCTDPLSGYRKRCIINFIDVDENGNPIKTNSFGSKKEKLTLKSIKRSSKAGKKMMAVFETNGRTKTIYFGQAGASDYLHHKDKTRRNRYIFRHHKDLRGNPAKAGYLSMFVLWNKISLQASIADYRRRLAVYNRTGKFPNTISGYNSPGKGQSS